MQVLKKTFSKNNNEIILIKKNNLVSDKDCKNNNVKSKTILTIGVIHGDEAQGKFLIENYINSKSTPPKMDENKNDKNCMLFIPCLNPDGLTLNTRQNANGVDLNRNFATKNWGEVMDEKSKCPDYFGGKNSASEIETRFVQEIIAEFSPDIVLTIHAPFKVVNFDGPAREIAEKISEIIEYPTQAEIGYPTPGSFGTYAGIERNIATITLELDEEASIETLQPEMNAIFDYLKNF